MKPATQKTQDQVQKILDLSLEAWVALFAIFFVIPLLNIIAIPMFFIVGTLVVAGYVGWNAYREKLEE